MFAPWCGPNFVVLRVASLELDAGDACVVLVREA